MSARRSTTRDAVAAARERLVRVLECPTVHVDQVIAFEAAIRADEQAKQRALRRAVDRSLNLLRNTVGDNVGTVKNILGRAQRRARTEGQ